MTRSELKKLAELRIREAKALFGLRLYHGAYYLCGYSLECGIKSFIAGQFKRNHIPDKNLVKDFYTHDLEKLMRLAIAQRTQFDVDCKANKNLNINWGVVNGWSETVRYNLGITKPMAQDMINACESKDGILTWIKGKW